ncbi:hypothetical protein SR39_23405 [Methylobacterium radiotolerans]|nr:hypothetical protein SR39_23405 [Methylobacterium radiotolerans]
MGGNALAQIGFEGIRMMLAGLARLAGWWLKAVGDVLADRLSVAVELPGDGGDGQALAVQVQDHDELLELNHHQCSSCSHEG